MSYLGQNNNGDYDFALENGIEEVPWWRKIWEPVKEVITTGAETFAKVAPYAFDRPELAPIKIPQTRIEIDPGTGRERTVTDSPYVPGQRLQPGTIIVTLPSGQQVTRRTQRAGIMPEWGMPLLLLGGGILLMNVMRKPRKK